MRPRRALLAALLALAVLLAGLALLVSGGRASPRRGGRGRRAGARVPPTRRALSPAGLPLAAASFPLFGLATSAREPAVRPGFRNPPRAGLLFNLESGQVLWSLRALQRVPIASLTKMMTALVSVRATPAHARVLITRAAVEMPGSKVGVLPLGRHVPFETLLYGLMLPSGNDAAVAIAEHVAGTLPAFVARMNDEAAALGLGCTRYSSPSGYYNAGNFSCARDLAELARADLAQPRIAEVVRTFSAALPFPIQGGRLYLYNNNPLLYYHYPGITGLKTGYTEAAGRCLIATATRRGVSLGVVILNSTDPGIQAATLLDDGFEQVYHQPPVLEESLPPGT